MTTPEVHQIGNEPNAHHINVEQVSGIQRINVVRRLGNFVDKVVGPEALQDAHVMRASQAHEAQNAALSANPEEVIASLPTEDQQSRAQALIDDHNIRTYN